MSRKDSRESDPRLRALDKELWRTKDTLRVVGWICIFAAIVVFLFPFVTGLMGGDASGASHKVSSSTFRALALHQGSGIAALVAGSGGVVLLFMSLFF